MKNQENRFYIESRSQRKRKSMFYVVEFRNIPRNRGWQREYPIIIIQQLLFFI